MLWEWVVAVIAASLLGSGHCVGMCGPFAVLATSGPLHQATWSDRAVSLASYHLGRLATYLILGALMGGLGSVADALAISAGWAPIAARWVGGLMVVMGFALLVEWWRGRGGVTLHSPWMARWNHAVLQIRKRWRVRSAAGVAFSWGMVSTWLPCGWLYVFAIAAAGAGGIVWGMVLMAAFWVGSLPLLSIVPLGAWWIAGRTQEPLHPTGANLHSRPLDAGSRFAAWIGSVQPFVQPAAACMLVAFGVLTATSRAEISLYKLKLSASNPAHSAPSEQLKDVIDQPLPCCEADEDTSQTEESERGEDK